MHIPTSDTKNVAVTAFADALAQERMGSADYDTEKWIYVPNKYEEYRYILGTRGNNTLICIGINPSTAVPGALDNTLKSVERIAHSNGYDSFIMFNVYAQRATNPDDMEESLNEYMHAENMKAFEYILSECESLRPSVWAAWGTIIDKRAYLPACVSDMIEIGKKYNAEWYSCGPVSLKGHPHHPLYLKKDSTLDPFDIESYIRARLSAAIDLKVTT